jgi:hypothetical protein
VGHISGEALALRHDPIAEIGGSRPCEFPRADSGSRYRIVRRQMPMIGERIKFYEIYITVDAFRSRNSMPPSLYIDILAATVGIRLTESNLRRDVVGAKHRLGCLVSRKIDALAICRW